MYGANEEDEEGGEEDMYGANEEDEEDGEGSGSALDDRVYYFRLRLDVKLTEKSFGMAGVSPAIELTSCREQRVGAHVGYPCLRCIFSMAGETPALPKGVCSSGHFLFLLHIRARHVFILDDPAEK